MEMRVDGGWSIEFELKVMERPLDAWLPEA